jgi:1,4-dihydroxy-6-naphthoate synthase
MKKVKALGNVRVRDFEIEHVLEEIEALNQRALRGELEVTAISAHAYPSIASRYWILPTGASVGRAYGPVVVARRGSAVAEGGLAALEGVEVALPGPLTTAALLARLYIPGGRFRHLPFDRILPAVQGGGVDAGVLIHEGQITFAEQGLERVADFGALWHDEEGLPLPLGLDVVRKDLGPELAREIDAALRASIRCAIEREDEAIAYALRFGRGIGEEVGRRFVRMYVNDDTLALPLEGRRALRRLYERAASVGLLAEPVTPEFVPGT